uniref:ABI family member 3 binding protein n=1 Tax=Podarcis muralis TaxID=64176 RepID=A0A670IKM3_PODMU
MRYIRPSPSTKLEGFILGYGSSFFSNQYIPLPSDGKSYITEVDAEPRYLIAVRPAPVPNYKKPCSGKTNTPKPLQLVIGTLTPTSVFLSWGILVNPKHDWTTMNNCANDRFYTVRYREKDKNKKWVLQLCPTTETVVDNLKPNTIYEFGVKDNTDNGVWSKIFNHKVAVPGKNKENGQLQNNYKIPRIPTQFIPADSKVQLPYTIIKQVLQNVTHRAQSKIPEKAPLAGPILVHLIVPDFNGTRQKLPSLDISERPEKKPAKNETQEWPAESKTPEVQEISPQSQPAMTELDWGSSKPTAASASEETKSSPAHSESEPESSKLNKTPLAKLPLDTLAHTEREVESSKPLVELPLDTQDKYSVHSISAADTGLLKATSAPHELPEIPKTKIPHTLQMPTEILASSEMQPVPSAPQPPAPKATPTRLVPEVKHRVSSPKPTIGPHVLHTKPDMKPVAHRTEPPKSELVPFITDLDSINLHIHVFNGPKATPEERDPVPSRPKTWLSPDVPQTKPVPKETRRVPARPRTSPSPGLTTTKPSQKGSRRVPPKPKTSPSPKTPHTKPVRKEMQPVPSKSKISSTTDTPQTGPEIIPFSQGPATTIIPHVPEKAKAMPASTVEQFIPNKSKPTTRPRMLETKPAVHRTTPQPLIIKPTISSERQKSTMAPKETRFIPPKPKTSGKPEVPQTKPAPIATDLGSINLHIHVFDGSKDTLASSKPYRGVTATESPHLKTAPHKVYFTTAKPKMTDKSQTRPVVGKTTPAPGRTRTSGGLTWDKVPKGDKLIDQDAARLLSTSSSTGSNTSVHSSVARKKPDPAPAKPTPMRRKPLPPNTVTGKPGGSGNVLMPRASSSSTAKPTGPAAHGKTSSHKKPPTASSSPDYSNRTLFNSQPTSDTDASGKRRFTGEGVLYIKKPEDVPCSITDTLQYFPTEEGDSTEVPTSPPRKPPTNLTVVTVEGCPTFVVLDWEKPPNETVTEYRVVSTENGSPAGKDKTIITTNQTHSTVENLKPNTSYEFVVIPSNPLGEGPSTESKPFKTESADPRVTEPISSKSFIHYSILW